MLLGTYAVAQPHNPISLIAQASTTANTEGKSFVAYLYLTSTLSINLVFPIGMCHSHTGKESFLGKASGRVSDWWWG